MIPHCQRSTTATDTPRAVFVSELPVSRNWLPRFPQPACLNTLSYAAYSGIPAQLQKEKHVQDSATDLNVTADTFMSSVVEASARTPILVDFWAPWCGPCKQLMPLLDRLAVEYSGRFVLAKVNTDEEQGLA